MALEILMFSIYTIIRCAIAVLTDVVETTTTSALEQAPVFIAAVRALEEETVKAYKDSGCEAEVEKFIETYSRAAQSFEGLEKQLQKPNRRTRN
jgi:hypothetical protein